MRRIAKKISCIVLTAALVAESLPGYVLAAEIQTEMSVTEQMEQVQTDQAQPKEEDGVLSENESVMSEGAVEVQTEEETVEEPPAEEIEEKVGRSVPQAGSRELLRDSFEDASGWKINQPNAVKIENGRAVIKGSGPNNAMASRGILAAGNFLMQADLTVGAGNTNCNAKIAFKAKEGFEQQRLQLRFDFPHNKVMLENVTGNTVNTTYKEATVAVSEGAHKLTVEVQDDTITAWLDEQEMITAAHEEIAGMEQGRLLFAGQYPAQDFALDNLLVTTNEQPSGKECTVTLETYTDGVLDANHKGGTLTADRLSGYSGDYVTLTPKANHGYVFARYETNTDNLVPVENDRFQLSEKFPQITVRAYFETRIPGKDELFFEDFGGDLGGTLPGINISDGELVVDVPEGGGYKCLQSGSGLGENQQQ